MLAVAKGDDNIECIGVLLAAGADHTCKDEQDNNLLHIAAYYGNNRVLDYFAKNHKFDLFARNKKGQTAFNISRSTKNNVGMACLEVLQKETDGSKSLADNLLNELVKEIEQAEKSKATKGLKKWRAKIRKLAKVEENSIYVEKRLVEINKHELFLQFKINNKKRSFFY